VLRDYLWGRLVAAIELNAPTLLQCLVVLKLPGAGGAEWLRDRTREQGFFVEAYNPLRPSPTLAAALHAEPTCAVAGAPIHFACQVVNRGYHTSPEFLVAIHGAAGEIDLREAAAKALDENIDRAFDTTGAFTHPGSHSATATAVLVTSNGTEARRELAWMGAGAAPCVTIRSNPPVVVEPGRDSWEAAGQTGTDGTFVFTVPDTPGQPFKVRCTVSAGACRSSGAETLTPLPPAEADRLIAACTFLKELRIEKLLPFFNRPDGRGSCETPSVLLPMVDTMAAAARGFVQALDARKREP
jgi:hypothetical protein